MFASVGLIKPIVAAVSESPDDSYTEEPIPTYPNDDMADSPSYFHDGIFYSVGEKETIGIKDGIVRYKKGALIECWYDENGLIHRDNNPAMIIKCVDGTHSHHYYQHGARHREDGPAVIQKSGKTCYYALNGQCMDREEWWNAVHNLPAVPVSEHSVNPCIAYAESIPQIRCDSGDIIFYNDKDGKIKIHHRIPLATGTRDPLAYAVKLRRYNEQLLLDYGPGGHMFSPHDFGPRT
jgi:hypothetical protein